MKKTILLPVSFLWLTSFAQDYWQQEVHYNIQVSLNDANHSLKGFESIEYVNHSPDTLNYIWFHLWPNAYREDSTALYSQLHKLGYADNPVNTETAGFIDSLQFTINGKLTITEKDPNNIDIVKLLLSTPFLPDQKIIISTPFFVKIPPYFSRMGYERQTFLISQWYPKPAVYDQKGWHPMPYLYLGEFYSEFGSYDVSITIPSGYVVGATGILETADELKQYKDLGRKHYAGHSQAIYRAANANQLKTLRFHADSVHDFAWFADKNFIINYDTLGLQSGRIIDVFSYYQPHGNFAWRNSISFIKDAVSHYSNWVGEYEYPVVSAVEGPGNKSMGGMEYPMITVINLQRMQSTEGQAKYLDDVIAHEIGHNWFCGMLANNERENAWMDEGINSYYEFRYLAEKYRFNPIFVFFNQVKLERLSEDDFLSLLYSRLNQGNQGKAIATPAAAFDSESDYFSTEYKKTALWMYVMEKSIGKNNLDKGMHNYFKEWKFKHVYPENLQSSLEEATRIGLDNLFNLLHEKGPFN